MNNRKEYLEELSKTRKKQLQEIRRIDEIINDKKLLQEEFEKRNKKRAKYNKIFNIKHLVEILNKDRKKVLMQMDEVSKLLEPNYFVKIKQNIEDKLGLLEVLDEKEPEKDKIRSLVNLQKIFLNGMRLQIKNANEKQDIINLIYKLRYYNFIYITGKTQIKDLEELKEELDKVQNELIIKAYELKVITRISKSIRENYEVIKNIFTSRIISLENINIELKISKGQTQINIYDQELFEKTVIISKNMKENLDIKKNKKIKIIQ